MTEKQRFKDALDRKPITGLVPTFELVFYLTMEAFSKVHPTHRAFYQWGQMSAKEKELQRIDAVDLYIETAKRYNHSAIFYHPFIHEFEDVVALDVTNGSSLDGATICQSVYNDANSMQWNLEDVGDGYFKVTNRNSGKVIQGSTTEGDNLVQYTYSPSNVAHKWFIPAF